MPPVSSRLENCCFCPRKSYHILRIEKTIFLGGNGIFLSGANAA
jgi:hypothetical protein